MNTNTINSKNVISGVNDLATKCPMAASMWSDKNDCSPSEVSAGNNKKAWFVCPDCKQEFEARVFHAARSLMRGNTGCPVCAGIKVVPGINDLATKCPKVVPLWSDKNDYTPSEISARSERRAIFVCPDCKKRVRDKRSRHDAGYCIRCYLLSRLQNADAYYQCSSQG